LTVGSATETVGTAPVSLGELLGRFPVLAPPTHTAGAAVTIVLREGLHEVETLLIVRSTRPDDPASGHVALPGGHVAEVDGSLSDTALRELEEEVGLGSSDLSGPLRFVGTQPAPRFGLTVGLFAAALSPSSGPARVRSPEEVATVFWMPRSSLAQSRKVVREGLHGPVEVHATVVDGEVLWGFTRRALRAFFGLPTEDELVGPAFAHTTARTPEP
jgi:ADP-ribose pyrophosphatase YjhB (NUDIX family)